MTELFIQSLGKTVIGHYTYIVFQASASYGAKGEITVINAVPGSFVKVYCKDQITKSLISISGAVHIEDVKPQIAFIRLVEDLHLTKDVIVATYNKVDAV